MPKIVDFLRGEMHILEKVQRLFESGGDQIIALRRKMAHEQLERGARIEAGLQVTRRHRQLVKIS